MNRTNCIGCPYLPIKGDYQKAPCRECKGEDIEKAPTEITCPHCGKVIGELKYTEYGHMRISDHSEGGGDMDFPDRAYHCPECSEEREYEDLEKAGVF